MIKVIGNRPVMKKGDNEIGVVGDNKVKTLDFSIDRIQGGIDLSGYSAWGLIERSPINGGESYSTLVTKTTLSDKITISLPITSNETRNYGYIYASIKFGSSKNITSFSDYGSGRIKATSTAHGIVGTQAGVFISGTTDYNGTYTVTRIDANNFYFTATWVSDQTGWWGVSPIWQTERVLLKIAKGINGETEAEALAPDIFSSQVAAFQEALDEALTLDYVLLDQSTPQSFTGGEVSGSGLLKVTSGAIGLDETPYVDSNTTFWNVLDDKASALSFGTSAEPRMLELVTTSGRKRVYVSKDLQIGGNIELRATTADSGQIKIGEHRFIHSYGNGCLFIGYDSGNFTVTGHNNSAVGYNALKSNTSGSVNSAMGNSSMLSNTTGTYNTAMGSDSLRYNTTGGQNSAIGHSSLTSNTTGGSNSAVGMSSLYSNTTGGSNSALGSYSLHLNTTGSYNTGVGAESLSSNKTGNGNSAIGFRSLTSNTTGYSNSAMGSDSLRYNTTGGQNAAMGYYSLYSNTTGNNNSAMGYGSIYSLQSGSSNIAIGSESGKLCASINNSIFIGSSTKALNHSGDINEIVIGHNAIGNGSNTVTLGNTGIVSTVLRGDVKIGTKLTDSTGINAADTVTMEKTDSSTKIATTQFVKNVLADFEVPEGGSITVNEVAPTNGNITLDTSNIESTLDRRYLTDADVDLLSDVTGGSNTYNTGSSSFTLSGFRNNITGTNSAIIAGGYSNVFENYSAIIGGIGNLVSSYCSATIGGQNLIASAVHSTIVGKFGETPADSLLAVANGEQGAPNIAFYVGRDGVSHFDEMPVVPADRVITEDNQLVDKKYVDENSGSTAITELTGSVLSVGNFYKTVSESISFTLPTADTSKSNLIMLDLEVVGNISIGFGTTYAANMSVPLMVAGNYLVSWEYSNIVSDWVVTVLPYGVIV